MNPQQGNENVWLLLLTGSLPTQHLINEIILTNYSYNINQEQ
jgi:hypothetical protein